MKKLRHITEVCKEIYEKKGFSAVCDYANKMMKNCFDIQYETCKACDTEAPAWNHICLACGQTTTPIPLPLPEQLRAEAQELIDLGDSREKAQGYGMMKVLDAFKVPQKGTRVNYFEVKNQGWNSGLEREEIQVNCGENGILMIVKTDEGFVVDAFDIGGNNINTMCVWEDDINPLVDDDEEESGAPENFSDIEIEEFKENWGQSQGEITSELGFPESHAKSDDLIIATGNYFWDEKDKKWYNKCASMFTEREQAIADYLRASN